MDSCDYVSQLGERRASQIFTTLCSAEKHTTVQCQNVIDQVPVDDLVLNLGDLDEIIGGESDIQAQVATYLPASGGVEPPSASRSVASSASPSAKKRPLPFTAPTPRSPRMPRSSLLRVLQAKGMTDLGVDLTTGERRLRVPLPADVDKAFDGLQITVRGKTGFRPYNCVGPRYTHYHPDPAILEVVEHAEILLDELIPGPDVLVDRGVLPDEQLATPSQVAIKDPPVGFTLAHLLTLICKSEYDAWHKKSTPDLDQLKHILQFEWLWITSVAKSDGREESARWFPELEVRIPEEYWKAPHITAPEPQSPQSPLHSSARLLHTPHSRPVSAAAYSPYPSPRKTQPQRCHSDRSHKKVDLAVASPPRPALVHLGVELSIARLFVSESIMVPLPDDINPHVRYPVLMKGQPTQRGVCLHTTDVQGNRLLAHLRETIMDADKPIIFGQGVDCTIVERALFPGEIRGRAGRPIKENDWTLAEILMRIMLKQREWYRKDVRTGLVQSLIATSSHPVWSWWAERGLHEDLIWIVAIRQTLPDPMGRTRWIPEIELRNR